MHLNSTVLSVRCTVQCSPTCTMVMMMLPRANRVSVSYNEQEMDLALQHGAYGTILGEGEVVGGQRGHH